MRFGIGKRVISLFLSLSFVSFSVSPCLCAPLDKVVFPLPQITPKQGNIGTSGQHIREIKRRKIYRKNPGENKFNAIMDLAVVRNVKDSLDDLGILEAIDWFKKQSLVVKFMAANTVVMPIFGKSLIDTIIDDVLKIVGYIWSKAKDKDAKWEDIYGVKYDRKVDELLREMSGNIVLIRPVVNLLHGLKASYCDWILALVDGYGRAHLGKEKDCVLSLDNIASDSLNKVGKVGGATMSKNDLFHIWNNGLLTKFTYFVGFVTGKYIIKKGNAKPVDN